MNIFLIGYRCTGKSTVGRGVAEKLNWKFVDADAELVSDQGCSIAQIVTQCGWEAFRRIEKSVLARLCESDNQIIATGGGVVLDGENVRCMKKNGPVIWLRASAETIYNRMTRDENTIASRPALTDKKTWDEILDTISERQPLYEAAMSGFVETDGKTVEAVCTEMVYLLTERGLKIE
ncbi:MAG: shikimate kinase [Pseudomonadota bacterium]